VKKVFDATTTLARNHGNHGSFLARTTGTTGTVKVGLVLKRWVELDNQRNVINVNTASGNVGCNKYANLATNKALEVAVTLALV
jgi:hypothetical protein